ncbi:MAG TPA: hypothetical protein VMW16_03545 [Sedimentisphaerales bacterium]|nr:hypothetical protein [Sedimentisphaerales bacterium]
MSDDFRPCWQNCFLPDEKDEELAAVDAMEDSLAPLDEDTARIRQLITRFESCYHEADKEAELIVKAIGSGRPPTESHQRPPKRKQELQNARAILLAWCEDTLSEVRNRDVGGISADELVSFIGERTALKIWQVQRVIDKVGQALDPSRKYHNMALNVGDYGEPGAEPAGEHYKDHSDFLMQTIETVIHDTIDGRKAQISLAMAIDRLQPCNWNFVNNVVVILRAIGGDLHQDRFFACCERNALLTPLGERLNIIANTLGAFWQGKETDQNIDDNILTALGEKTPVKCWLAASLDKTIRLQLDPVNVKQMTEFVERLLK